MAITQQVLPVTAFGRTRSQSPRATAPCLKDALASGWHCMRPWPGRRDRKCHQLTRGRTQLPQGHVSDTDIHTSASSELGLPFSQLQKQETWQQGQGQPAPCLLMPFPAEPDSTACPGPGPRWASSGHCQLLRFQESQSRHRAFHRRWGCPSSTPHPKSSRVLRETKTCTKQPVICCSQHSLQGLGGTFNLRVWDVQDAGLELVWSVRTLPGE